MNVPVLVESVANNGYRATTGQPLVLSAEGSTREEAMEQLHIALHKRLNGGAEIVAFELDPPEHPLTPYAGMFKDNPLFDAWQTAIEERRSAEDQP